MIILVPNIRRYFTRLFSGTRDRSVTQVDLFVNYITTQLAEKYFGPITFKEQFWPPIASSFTNEPIELDQNFTKLITYKKISDRFARMALIKKPYANKSGICLIQSINLGIEKTYTITISFSSSGKEFTVFLKN
jgi:hypothetical protein